MKAYKCDECNQLFEGDSEEEFSTNLNDRYEVRIEVRVKWSEEAKKEEVAIEEKPYGLISYSSIFGGSNLYKTGDSRDCDLCKDCAQSIAKEAIRMMNMKESVST